MDRILALFALLAVSVAFSPPLNRPKILCLHGGGNNGPVFEAGINALIVANPQFEFVFPSAPYQCADGICSLVAATDGATEKQDSEAAVWTEDENGEWTCAGAGCEDEENADAVWTEDENGEWTCAGADCEDENDNEEGSIGGRVWIMDPPNGKDDPTTDPDFDIASYTALDALVAAEGPFHGILGYSQGAMYVSAYLAHAPVGTFNVAIMFCGYLPNTHLGVLQRINDRAPMNTPAFIYMGVNDAIISNAQTEETVAMYSSVDVVTNSESSGGHAPPAPGQPGFDEVVAFLSSSYLTN